MSRSHQNTRGCDVMVLGGINTDFVMSLDRLPVPGESLKAKAFSTFPGGKGANQAVACAKMGASVSFISALGDDFFGDRLRQEMQRRGVDMSYVSTNREFPSGTAMIMVDETGQNLIAFSPGAAEHLSLTHIEGALRSLRAGDIFLAQLELGTGIVFPALTLAKQRGLTVIWNPAPAPDVAIPEEIIRSVDVIIPNETEAEAITGCRVLDLTDAERASDELRQMGFDTVIITLGKRGVLSNVGGEKVHIKGIEVDAVDATAAGDVFVGAFSSQLAKGSALFSALEFANCAAALSTTRAGAMPSIPESDEVKAALTKHQKEGGSL
ncbi:ribokinase [Candidatus Acetothermia bacterium]|nr:MAG: ribokinase [Candidatus Acetothermia bacterium]